MINLISDYFFNNYDEDATEYWNGTCSKLGSAVAVGWVDPELANNELKKCIQNKVGEKGEML